MRDRLIELIVNAENSIYQEKPYITDTVRKMHSMLCEGRVSNDNVVIVANQIKKEMLDNG